MIDWDAYRAAYDLMSWDDQRAFYDRVWDQHPVQLHYDAEACARFLEATRPATVMEIGGWRGELAGEMLARYDWIGSWHNREVCAGAATNPATDDPRYRANVPTTWPWHVPLRAEAFVASHTIEHMNARQLDELFRATSARAMFLASPLTDDGQDWAGYGGSHVLTIGWRDVIALAATHGFVHDRSLDASEVRCFRR